MLDMRRPRSDAIRSLALALALARDGGEYPMAIFRDDVRAFVDVVRARERVRDGCSPRGDGVRVRGASRERRELAARERARYERSIARSRARARMRKRLTNANARLTTGGRTQSFHSQDARVCEGDAVGVYARFASRADRLRASVTFGENATLKTYENVRGEVEDEIATRGCGTYKLCFTNHATKARAGTATVEIDYFQALHKPGNETSDEAIPAIRAESTATKGMLSEDIGAAEAKVSGLNNWVQLMREEVKHLRNRAIRHKATVQSNSRRMTRTTMIEVCVLIVVSIVQVFTVRRFFDVQTQAHARQRAASGGSMYRNGFGERAFANGIAGVTRVAGPMAGAAADAASRGVAGLMKSLRRTPQKSHHLG